jgi:hypothetical protein
VVTIDKGHFSVLLGLGSADGAKPPLHEVFTGVDASSRWMELTVGDKVISPRIQFFAAPYAQLARVANELASDTGDITSTGTIQTTGDIDARDVKASGKITGASMDLGTGTISSGAISTSGNISASGSISSNTMVITPYLQVNGNLVQENGNFFSSGNITGKAIMGTSLTATTGTFKGELTVNSGISMSGNIISAVGYFQTPGGFYVGPNKAYLYDNHLRDVKQMWNNQGDKKMNINGSLTVNRDGNVGINQANPRARLHVSGGSVLGETLNTGNSGLFNFNVEGDNDWDNIPLQTGSIAALFDGNVVVAGSYISSSAYTISDERAKNVIGATNGQDDLRALNKIEIKDFDWIDKITHQAKPQKKVTAQQLEKVYPQAVSIIPTPQAVPSIYEMASDISHDDSLGLLSLAVKKKHGLQPGDKIDLHTDTDILKEIEVVNVHDEHRFSVKTHIHPKQAFVYGKYVDDFRCVDYEAISMLNVSATQELARQAEDLESRVRDLEARERRLALLEENLEAKMSRMEAFEKRLDALDKRLVSVSPQIDRNTEGLQVSVSTGSSR